MYTLIGIAVLLITVGSVLIWFARRKSSKRFKIPILLLGASLVGSVVFSILHNLVYALSILMFGEDLWNFSGGDEPSFMLLAVIVCPIGIITGLAWILVLKMRKPQGE